MHTLALPQGAETPNLWAWTKGETTGGAEPDADPDEATEEHHGNEQHENEKEAEQ
jgi:hypothetical protein